MTTITQNNGVPENTYIYVSKFRVYIRIFLGVLIIAGVAYIYLNGLTESGKELNKAKFAVYIGPLAALLLFYQAFTSFKKKGAQITLNDKGITIAEKEPMLWNDISEIKITWGNRKVLNFKHREEKINVNFETFNIKPFELESLINTYKKRHLQNTQRNLISEQPIL